MLLQVIDILGPDPFGPSEGLPGTVLIVFGNLQFDHHGDAAKIN